MKQAGVVLMVVFSSISNIFCRSITGRMCGDNVPDVAALI